MPALASSTVRPVGQRPGDGRTRGRHGARPAVADDAAGGVARRRRRRRRGGRGRWCASKVPHSRSAHHRERGRPTPGAPGSSARSGRSSTSSNSVPRAMATQRSLPSPPHGARPRPCGRAEALAAAPQLERGLGDQRDDVAQGPARGGRRATSSASRAASWSSIAHPQHRGRGLVARRRRRGPTVTTSHGDVGAGGGEGGGADPGPEVVLGPHPRRGDVDDEVLADPADRAREATRPPAGSSTHGVEGHRAGVVGDVAERVEQRRVQRHHPPAGLGERAGAERRAAAPRPGGARRAPTPPRWPRCRRVAGEAHRSRRSVTFQASSGGQREGDGVVALLVGSRAARSRGGGAAGARGR